jgi:hypothetical protein
MTEATEDEVVQLVLSQSTRASDLARQLTYAGLAAVWAFATRQLTNDHTATHLSTAFIPALALFSVVLFLDMLQYLSVVLKNIALRDGVSASGMFFHRVHMFSFFAKMGIVLIAYVALVIGFAKSWPT